MKYRWLIFNGDHITGTNDPYEAVWCSNIDNLLVIDCGLGCTLISNADYSVSYQASIPATNPSDKFLEWKDRQLESKA